MFGDVWMPNEDLMVYLIRPSLISPRTKLIGVSTNGLPAVIMLKISLNQHGKRMFVD